MVWLMLCAALPAFGAESAPHVTAETTMAQLRANPEEFDRMRAAYVLREETL